MTMITIIRERGSRSRDGRVACVFMAVLFLVMVLCFTFTIQITEEILENSESDSSLIPETDNFAECPIESWNAIETNRVPFGDFKVIERWEKRRRGTPFHPSVLNAFLFNEYIMVIIDTKNMSGRSVVCRYFDCLRREIPSQFESKIYPESVVYCPRRIGVHWMSITGNLLEKPIPIAIENASLATGDNENLLNLKIDEE
ncbi:unnamed protein product [Caenorhabditis brenneri]